MTSLTLEKSSNRICSKNSGEIVSGRVSIESSSIGWSEKERPSSRVFLKACLFLAGARAERQWHGRIGVGAEKGQRQTRSERVEGAHGPNTTLTWKEHYQVIRKLFLREDVVKALNLATELRWRGSTSSSSQSDRSNPSLKFQIGSQFSKVSWRELPKTLARSAKVHFERMLWKLWKWLLSAFARVRRPLFEASRSRTSIPYLACGHKQDCRDI